MTPSSNTNTRHPRGDVYTVVCRSPCLALSCLGGFLLLLFSLNLETGLLITRSLRTGNTDANAPAVPLSPSSQQHNFSLLIGILILPDRYETRHFLRLVYGAQTTPVADVDVKFVLCNLTTEEQKVTIALEILRFDDIIILNCTENIEGGKSYTFFSSLPAIVSRRYDYVMKTDDDTYVGVGPLARTLLPLPREDLYFGYVTPCSSTDAYSGYMSGMGYVLSWDLVEWISTSEIPRNKALGIEDILTGMWLNEGNKASNRFTAKPAMYDFPGTKYPGCTHELVPETVAIHQLKTRDKWIEVLKFFNFTKPLKPSKLYPVDQLAI